MLHYWFWHLVAVSFVDVGPGKAQNRAWCTLPPIGAGGDEVCAYSTLEQCRETARGSSLTCIRNPGPAWAKYGWVRTERGWFRMEDLPQQPASKRKKARRRDCSDCPARRGDISEISERVISRAAEESGRRPGAELPVVTD